MPRRETDSNVKTPPRVVEQPDLPIYEFQELEHGSGSVSGNQESRTVETPERAVNRGKRG